MKRREFTQICTSMTAAIAAGISPLATATEKKSYPKSLLLTEDGNELSASQLTPGIPYLFFYPYISTPCFLIDLGSKTTASGSSHHDAGGNKYQWSGGVGPTQSIVAYSAICSHKMSHPAKEISFISYRHDNVSFFNSAGKTEERGGVISCCSERSVYDAADGARVLGGPAPQPLAAIELSYEQDSGALYATASYGGDMYERFFEKFGFRAAIEHEVTDPATLVGDKSVLRKLSSYSGQTIKC